MVSIEVRQELLDEMNRLHLAKPRDYNTVISHLLKKIKIQAIMPSVPTVEKVETPPVPITEKLTEEELTSILEGFTPVQISQARKLLKKQRYTKDDIADFIGALSQNQLTFLRDELCTPKE